MKRVVTFGEIMGRMTPSGFSRLRQSLPGTLEVTFAGAEANVAGSLVTRWVRKPSLLPHCPRMTWQTPVWHR